MEVLMSIKRLIQSQAGATQIEYAFIAILVSIAAIAFISVIGDDVQMPFVDAESGLQSGISTK